MKIRLLVDLPIDPKHGMIKGRVLEVISSCKGSDRFGQPRWFVRGDTDEEIGVLPREAGVVKE